MIPPSSSRNCGRHDARSALDLRAPNARTERHRTTASRRARSAPRARPRPIVGSVQTERSWLRALERRSVRPRSTPSPVRWAAVHNVMTVLPPW